MTGRLASLKIRGGAQQVFRFLSPIWPPLHLETDYGLLSFWITHIHMRTLEAMQLIYMHKYKAQITHWHLQLQHWGKGMCSRDVERPINVHNVILVWQSRKETLMNEAVVTNDDIVHCAQLWCDNSTIYLKTYHWSITCSSHQTCSHGHPATWVWPLRHFTLQEEVTVLCRCYCCLSIASI